MSDGGDDAAQPEPSEAGSSAGLAGLRDAIDAVDRRVLAALSERRRLSREVVLAKARGEVALRDVAREEQLLVDRIRRGEELGLDGPFVTRVFHQIIDDSVRLQQEVLQSIVNEGADTGRAVIRAAFLGIEGSYSHIAARHFFARRASSLVSVPCGSFADIVRAVESGVADFGLLPIENTTSGGINETYDLLVHTSASIVGELKLRIDHCLLGLPGATLDALRVVHSHPQPLAQCSQFLERLSSVRVSMASDTATSVREVRESEDPTHAAIASADAGRMFGLEVIAADIANHTQNFTRFLVIARSAVTVDVRVPAKTSLVISTSQTAGALVEALLVFRAHGLNLTKLESRPILGNPWEEMFYIDVDGNVADPRMAAALEGLAAHARFLKVLGTYPTDDVPATPVGD
ncbi:MAG: prephenate dehydratase [Myxococcales bacterium]|nr:prephenate dehydratase [Myxococcales bacterium]